jgi:hypothetical protein
LNNKNDRVDLSAQPCQKAKTSLVPFPCLLAAGNYWSRIPSQNLSFFKTQVAPPSYEELAKSAVRQPIYLPVAAPSGAAFGTHPAVFSS